MERDYLLEIIFISLFASLAIVLKYYAIATPIVRFSLFEMPLIIIGITYGPFRGATAGFAVDLIYSLFLSPFGFSINLFTVSSISYGLIAGLLLYKHRFELKPFRTFLTVSTCLAIAFILNSIWLYYLSGAGMLSAVPMRLLAMVVKVVVYSFACLGYVKYLKIFEKKLYHG